MESYDLVVIGGGAAGLVTASGAAQLGAKVMLIELARLGGECLWNGCVPSKSLIQSAKVKRLLDKAASLGFFEAKPQPDFSRVMQHMREVIMAIQPHDDPERFRKMGVTVESGKAVFEGRDRVSVNGRTVRARRFCVATGAGPAVPPIEGLRDVPFMTNENFFEQTRRPEHLLIVGGGPIGCEMGQAFFRLGSRVTIVEALDGILMKDDRETAGLLKQLLAKEGVGVDVGTQAVRVEHKNGVIRLVCQKAGANITLEGDALLVATGKRPRVDGLGLEAAGVEYDRRGIRVDRTMRTTNPVIYACGDVTGGLPFTHTAEYEAGLVVFNALIPLINRRADYGVIPWCTFTDPELAHVGLNEEEARRRFGPDGYRIWRFPVGENDRHIIEGETEGVVKLLTRPGGRILGCTILSAQAGEMIHEYALALKKKATVADISGLVHAYPTRTQANKRASDRFFAERFFKGRIPKILSWWLGRVRPKAG